MWTRADFVERIHPPVIGMVHLAPLPGSPGWNGDWGALRRAALADAEALAAGGAGAVLVENFGDVPFFPTAVPVATVAAMATLVRAITDRHPGLPVGVNVLRNDAEAALAVAAAGGAAFIRVNVHIGTTVTDQGLISGRAHRTLRRRRELGLEVGILADLRVKHGTPLTDRPLGQEAEELRERGLADGIILTGAATGACADLEQFRTVRAVLGECPLLAGSGVTSANVTRFAPWADGYIVGTGLQETNRGRAGTVRVDRVTALVEAVVAANGTEGKGIE
jgi:membrane complex biogenesis BtpA family protein